MSFVIIPYNLLDSLKNLFNFKSYTVIKWLLLIVWRLGEPVFSFCCTPLETRGWPNIICLLEEISDRF